MHILAPSDKRLPMHDLNERYRQLNDDRTYQAIEKNPPNRTNKESDRIRKRLLENKMITRETYKAMRSKSVHPGRFFMLPKIHKLNHPGRPIVLCIQTPT